MLIGVVLQLAVVSQFTFLGANADLAPLIVLSVGLLGGPGGGLDRRLLPSGFVVDMSLVQTLGVSSLLLTGVGYLAGRYRELRDASHSLVPPIAAALATLAYAAASRSPSSCSASTPRSARCVIRDFLVGGAPQRVARDPGLRRRPRDPAPEPGRVAPAAPPVSAFGLRITEP